MTPSLGTTISWVPIEQRRTGFVCALHLMKDGADEGVPDSAVNPPLLILQS